MNGEIEWSKESARGETYSETSTHRAPQRTVPYVIDRRHDGISLSVNLLVRGIDTPEKARQLAQAICDLADKTVKKEES